MFNGIMNLKNKGYEPDLILDIGAYKGIWTQNCKNIYSNSKYLLFEAIDYPELDNLVDKNTIINKICLFDKITEINWYQKKNTGDSIFKELSFHFNDCELIKKTTTTLDEYFKNIDLIQNYEKILIKIDTQGSEINILKGGLSILNKVNFIILEIPFFGKYNENVPNFVEHIQFMDSIGFIPYDILEHHYINEFNMQIDMIFIQKKHSFNMLVQDLLK